jgi:hypothetical protein
MHRHAPHRAVSAIAGAPSSRSPPPCMRSGTARNEIASSSACARSRSRRPGYGSSFAPGTSRRRTASIRSTRRSMCSRRASRRCSMAHRLPRPAHGATTTRPRSGERPDVLPTGAPTAPRGERHQRGSHERMCDLPPSCPRQRPRDRRRRRARPSALRRLPAAPRAALTPAITAWSPRPAPPRTGRGSGRLPGASRRRRERARRRPSRVASGG